MLPKHQEVKHGESGYLHARDKTGCILLLTPFSHKKKGSCWGGEHIDSGREIPVTNASKLNELIMVCFYISSHILSKDKNTFKEVLRENKS